MIDEQLFLAFVTGDGHALTDLVARYRDPVMRYLTGKGLQHADADDVFQAVFARIADCKDRSDRLLKPWIYTLADRLCREKLAANRQAARRLKTPEMEVMAEVYAR